MHFIRAVVYLFAFSSFTAAQYAEDEHTGLSRRELAEAREDFLAARDEYLAARDEYIEKRDLFRRGPLTGTCDRDPKIELPPLSPGKLRPAPKGDELVCVHNRKSCGPCQPVKEYRAKCDCEKKGK